MSGKVAVLPGRSAMKPGAAGASRADQVRKMIRKAELADLLMKESEA